jgi:peroxiredoxin
MRPLLLLSLLSTVALLIGGARGQAATVPAGVGAEIKAVIDEYEDKVRANTRKMIDAKTEAEKNQYRASVPTVAPYATKVMAIIKAHLGQPETARGVSWLVTQAAAFPEGQEALTMIGTSYVTSGGIAEAIKALEYHPLAMAEPILTAVREKNSNPTEKAAATYALGVQYFRIFETASSGTPPAAPNQECCGNDGTTGKTAAPLLSPEAEKAKARAMDLFQEVTSLYPKEAIQGFPLAEQASRMIFEMANLSVGVVAPEIEGQDLDGNAFKLSDFRGKHVMLIFWGGWCHACHDIVPMASQLASDMKDKPVAVLGINTDIPEEARAAYKQYQVNFRNWSDGTTGGPITTMFNLRSFPTIYLIDPKGVIVLKNTSVDAVREKLKGI